MEKQACHCCGHELPKSGILLDERNRVLSFKGKSERFVPKEWGVIMHLARRPNIAFTREQLFDAVYADYQVCDWPEIKIIDVFISRARKKLEGTGVVICTNWRHGWYIDFGGSND